MRQFFEEWGASAIRQPLAGKIENVSSRAHKEQSTVPDLPVLEIRQTLSIEMGAISFPDFLFFPDFSLSVLVFSRG